MECKWTNRSGTYIVLILATCFLNKIKKKNLSNPLMDRKCLLEKMNSWIWGCGWNLTWILIVIEFALAHAKFYVYFRKKKVPKKFPKIPKSVYLFHLL